MSLPTLLFEVCDFYICICRHQMIFTLESGINVPLRLLIFRIYSRGYNLITGLKRLKFYYISLHILRGYVYSFCQILQRLRLFKGLRLWSIIGQEDVQQFAKNLDLHEVLTIQRFTIQVFREL